MTVSSTRAWTSDLQAVTERLARALALRLWALCLWVGLALGAAPAQAAEITTLSAERSADGVVLTAQVRLDLPPLLEDALLKGVPLHFVAEAVILRDRWYWTDKEVARASRHLRLAYHPLARRWRLLVSSSPITNPGAALGQSFESREDALAAIERIAGWKIAEPSDVDASPRYTLVMRFRLDQAQLPRPVQIGTLGQDETSLEATRSLRLNPEPGR